MNLTSTAFQNSLRVSSTIDNIPQYTSQHWLELAWTLKVHVPQDHICSHSHPPPTTDLIFVNLFWIRSGIKLASYMSILRAKLARFQWHVIFNICGTIWEKGDQFSSQSIPCNSTLNLGGGGNVSHFVMQRSCLPRYFIGLTFYLLLYYTFVVVVSIYDYLQDR